MEITLKGFQCLRCGHQWKPRKAGSPVKCPNCDSPNWQTPRREGMPPHLAEVFQLNEVPQDLRDDIIRYAYQHPAVTQALVEAVPELEKVFGKTRRRLKLSVDLEEDRVELFGMVLVNEDLEKAYGRLEEFDQAWFLSVPTDVRMNLNFTMKLEDDYPPV